MDPVAARRTQAGEPVVHGVHVLLWTLECLTQAELPLENVRQLKVDFARFVHLDERLAIQLGKYDGASAIVSVVSDAAIAMTLLLRFGPRPATTLLHPKPPVEAAGRPQAMQIEQMAGRAGWLVPPVPPSAFSSMFPNAAASFGARRLSGLAQLSRLVGMICPGLHSIFASLTVDATDVEGSELGIGYLVQDVDDRFRLIKMAVQGEGLAGQVRAFVRQAPVEPPAMAEVARHVDADEFAGTTSLIVGGSRGLGATTAKLIAAGGGQVIATFARGRDEARKLHEEIARARGEAACGVFEFDVDRPIEPQLSHLKGSVDQVYYFVSPKIFVQRGPVFSPDLFKAFSRYYVEYFFETCRTLHFRNLSVFYPSSVSVESRPEGMLEYSMAKQAGEMLCSDMTAAMPGLRILVNRLPRVLTDQTATVASVKNADPLEVMLPLVRAMHAPA